MEDILVGIIKFFGSIIEDVPSYSNTKKAIVISFIILILSFIIVYILTKDY